MMTVMVTVMEMMTKVTKVSMSNSSQSFARLVFLPNVLTTISADAGST